jgi:hypothetical protein
MHYAGHQVGPKYSRSRNFSFIFLKGEAVGVDQILRLTATARDTWNFFALKSYFSTIKALKRENLQYFFFIFLDSLLTDTSLIFHM